MSRPWPSGIVPASTGLEEPSEVMRRLWEWDERRPPRVGALVPGRHDAYARVLHPARKRVRGAYEDVSWRTIGSTSGRVLHAEAQFPRLSRGGEGAWDMDPTRGTPPQEFADLVNVLSAFTSTPDACWFLLWRGYSFLQDMTTASTVLGQHREYIPLKGPLTAVVNLRFDDSIRAPNVWWPSDQEWHVASEIDLDSTYVGGTATCIDAILAAPSLEALRVDRSSRVDLAGDGING